MRPDALPPVETTFVSEILLAGPLTIDAARVAGALAERRMPTNPERPWQTTGEGMARDWAGGGVRVSVHATPVKAELLDKPIHDASGWWPADRARAHTHVARIEARSTEISAAMVTRLHARLTAAIIDTAPAELVLGVLWSGERLYPGDYVRAAAEEDPALGVLMGVHVGKAGEAFALRTTGLPALGLMNFEVPAAPGGELQAMAATLKQCVAYLVMNGPVIKDGDTLGDTAEAQMTITHQPASWGGETAYRLTFTGGVADGLQAVTCPQCGEAVRGRVEHYGPIPMLESCPKCGVGPIALLQEMLDQGGFEDEEVTVTFRTANTTALAGLLADYDPEFDTVEEAAAYVRDNHEGDSMTRQMSRTFAELLADAAGEEHPDVQVDIEQ